MNDPSLERIMTGFDFKFFVQSTRWLPMQVSKNMTKENTLRVVEISLQCFAMI
jgi:hypothetical protein